MRLDLRKKTQLNQSEPFQITIDERLPSHIMAPVTLTCYYEVQQICSVMLLKLKQQAELKIDCQRCLTTFDVQYDVETEIAICPSEQIANDYQETYDVIVVPDLQVDLKEILVDNLYLFSPTFHENIELCDRNQLKLMQNE